MDIVLNDAVKRVLGHEEFTKRFKHPVKFNGTDFVECRLTAEEQFAEVSKLATQSLHVFLERFGTLLLVEDLRALSSCPGAATAEAQFWLTRLSRAPLSEGAKQKRSRRRRWVWAKREMASSEGFFCEEAMKHRNPKLFHKLVGQHLDSSTRLSAPMKGSLSGYLMQRLEQDELQTEGDLTNTSELPDNDDSEEDDEVGVGGVDDAALRRAKLLKTMRNRFMDGHEEGFDYAAIDADSDLDDVVELGRDAEEKYFDAA